MQKTAIALSLSIATAAILLGCKNPDDNMVAKTNSTYAVVVGMEQSRLAGACPGAGYDAARMKTLLSQYTSNISYLRDANATKTAVSSALRNAIAKAGSGLVVFYYSGHGGSDPFPNTGAEEVDGKDEYLCLYDTYMKDNEVWEIIKTCRGRFFLLVDACHSETMWRSPGFRVVPPLSYDHEMGGEYPFSMLCWSGCPDSDYSYGSAAGGQFTNALLRHFAANKTYEYLWNEIKNDRVLRAAENPQSTAIGDGFTGKPMFR